MIEFDPVNQQDVKVIVTYHPILPEGQHLLKYVGGDQTGNSDTLENIINVSYALKVRNLYNYPNPMTSDTYFTFELLGGNNPASYCRIKIYTVAGRLIKELPVAARIGFNQVYWDGRDNDGENIANGIYLYKLIVEDNNKTETSIQKLAVLK
jgi:hypothetical protein